ncbi:MAG: EAL domain-containing protein [Leptospirales bacterium]
MKDRSSDRPFSSSERTCPRCDGPVYRIPRRDIDLLVSIFIPVRRYRCDSMDCGWEGTVREKKSFLKKMTRVSDQKTNTMEPNRESREESPVPIDHAPENLQVTPSSSIPVLLVENDPVLAKRILKALGGAENWSFHVEWVTQLSEALERLNKNGIEIILLDLSLPDVQGIPVFEQVFQASPHSIILILSSVLDEVPALQAVHLGAFDSLDKSRLDKHWLPRSIGSAIERKNALNALQNSEARFRAMSDDPCIGVAVSDEQDVCIYTNEAYQKISGLTFEQAQGPHWSETIHPEDRERFLSEYHRSTRDKASIRSEVRFLQKEGSEVWTRVTISPILNGTTLCGHLLKVEDLTRKKAAKRSLKALEEKLFEEKERARVSFSLINDAVLITDNGNNVTYLNPVAETMTGWSCEEALGHPLPEVFNIIDGTTDQESLNPEKPIIDEKRHQGPGNDCVLIHREGIRSKIAFSKTAIQNRSGQISGTVIVFCEPVETLDSQLNRFHLSQHDFLTGLPNRVLLMERLSQAVARARRNQKQVALMCLYLDDFKKITDSLGHTIGDQLLRSVSVRLSACIRNTDTICRQGGNEFVILLSEIEHQQEAVQVTERLISAFSTPHPVGMHEHPLALNIGISIYPDDGTNEETILANAETALHHAKSSEKNSYQFFRADMTSREVRRLSIESSLQRALEQGEFMLQYQPKINLASGSMTGSEALIRWRDPNRGIVYPADFVSVAEECGLIVPIGRWVLREVCRQAQFWRDSGLRALPVSVNISPVEFRDKHFLEGVVQILKDSGLPPRYLELELTESVLMHETEDSLMVLKALDEMGVQIAIDDFGTGYSSLSDLKRFSIHTLKIDQSFVREIATDEESASIVRAVIGMGKNLRQRVIAEGIETHEQMAYLRTLQCDGGQGFYFSHPLSTENFELMLVSGNDDPTQKRLD